MDNRKKMMIIFKRIASVAFAVSFLMAIVLFGRIGTDLISPMNAKYIFIASGAVALLFNLLSFESGKHSPVFSFIYWAGSFVVFIGLVFFIFRWPYGFYILIAGLFILGGSLLINPERSEAPKNDDILDS